MIVLVTKAANRIEKNTSRLINFKVHWIIPVDKDRQKALLSSLGLIASFMSVTSAGFLTFKLKRVMD